MTTPPSAEKKAREFHVWTEGVKGVKCSACKGIEVTNYLNDVKADLNEHEIRVIEYTAFESLERKLAESEKENEAWKLGSDLFATRFNELQAQLKRTELALQLSNARVNYLYTGGLFHKENMEKFNAEITSILTGESK